MISVEINYPTVDLPKTEEKIHQHMTEFTLEALKVWALNSWQPIPVWSGAARATFIKAAQEARSSVEISPVAPSRIPLGIEETTFEFFAVPGKEYGWEWQSDLAHLPIVEDRTNFVEKGLDSISNLDVELPNPEFKQ